MEWSRRNWTRNLPGLQGLIWQMSLGWGRRGGWVMGRKNWMSFRVSFSLIQTGWSSRQMLRREVCWRERGISRLERSGGGWRITYMVPALTGCCKEGHCKGLEEGGATSLEIWLLWWQEDEGEQCGWQWTDSRQDLEEFVGLAENIVKRLPMKAVWSSSACNPTVRRISTYRENKWYSSCPYELFISNECDDLVWIHGLPETGQDKSMSGRKDWTWHSLLSLRKFSFWSEYKLSS